MTDIESSEDYKWMKIALEQAQEAAKRDEVPVGAVLVDVNTGEMVAKEGNRTIEREDPTAHAEMLVIREGCYVKQAQRIPECDLYVTLEPCTMCAGAISFARIRRVIIGTLDEKGGAVINGVRFYDQKTCHHKPEVAHGIFKDDCSLLLKNFFQQKRINSLKLFAQKTEEHIEKKIEKKKKT